MKTIYKAVVERLTEKVPDLRWVDLDTGQLDRKNDRPAVAWPCALISIDIPQCKNLTDTVQTCQAKIVLRIAFDPEGTGRTAANAPNSVREEALKPYDVISEVYKALQGYETPAFCPLTRTGQEKENRSDLFVYKMMFRCEFEDETAD
ncbi:MAG: hypothetical protein LBS05_09435 [Tannerellaceae bacterium]|jgi:hypothetical protein|nr:hypothetical protein [Tannerellaceae bacterium]